MTTAPDDDQRLRDLQREYVDLLDDSGAGGEGVFTKKVQEMVDRGEHRVILSINDVRRRNPERARGLLKDVFIEVVAFRRALREFVSSLDPSYAKSSLEFHVGFEGSFGSHHVSPRSLTSSHLNHLVCLEGIVTKASLVNPKVARSVHFCQATGRTTERAYTDLTSLEAFPSTAAYPTQDEDGNPLQTEFGLSVYRDHQTITIQELPEKAPTGQLPRAVDVICEDDLVDKAKPGDRVQVVGCFRCLPNKQGGFTSGAFRSVVLVNNVICNVRNEGVTNSTEDLARIRKLAKSERDVFSVLARSLAPSIHGHNFVKQALLCQLLGGTEKILPNGTRIRGDINVLLIGDPSVAKSQMLRYVLQASNRSVTTTGRGSSGVGLTAAVTTDQETGERRLEAGAMVLADRGIVCIDEFDKMTDMDRTAIHEVMEQGRVTISKAGIHARLNARCSVLAAANPVYGRYDPFRTPMENIGLQDSLLSRFDLLFILLDTIDVDNDKKISDHVVNIHQYRSSHESDGAVTTSSHLGAINELDTTRGASSKKKDETNIWDKTNYAHGRSTAKDRGLTLEFVRKYIEHARLLRPALTERACEIIGEEYSQLRSQNLEGTDVAKTQPITARSLETMIRLATAHAKARLSTKVDAKDAEFAIRLIEYAYFKKVLEKRRKRKGGEDDSESEEEEEEEEEEDEEEEASQEPAAKKGRMSTEVAVAEVIVSDDLVRGFTSKLSELFRSAGQLPMGDVVSAMAEHDVCTPAQAYKCVEIMAEQNKVMLSGDVLYRI